jgi:predicted ATPase
LATSIFLTRVVLRNYKSIATCDVRLGPLTYLVGANGSGKSNFLDALHLVRDALTGSLDSALNERGGLSEVRRRSSGHPTHFGVRLEFVLRNGQSGRYAFNVAALAGRGYEVQTEECVIGGIGRGPYFSLEHGSLKASSEATFPAVTPDRLALVSASGLAVFRPVYDALTAMGFYNLNPRLMRELQKPQDGRLLKPAGENIASVLGHLERIAPDAIKVIEDGGAHGAWGGTHTRGPDGIPLLSPGHGGRQTPLAVPGHEHVRRHLARARRADSLVSG